MNSNRFIKSNLIQFQPKRERRRLPSFSVSEDKLNKVSGFVIGEITKNNELIFTSQGKKEIVNKKGYDHFSNAI